MSFAPKVYRELMRAVCPHGFTVAWGMDRGAPVPRCGEHGWTEATARTWAARELTAEQLRRTVTVTVTDGGTTDPAALPEWTDGTDAPQKPSVPPLSAWGSALVRRVGSADSEPSNRRRAS